MNQGSKLKRGKHVALLFFVFAFAAGLSAVQKMTASADNLPPSKNGRNSVDSDAASKSDSAAPTSFAADSDISKTTSNPMTETLNTSLNIGFEDYDATAYCLTGSTASGMRTREGIIAADPRIIPMGSVVHIRAGRYSGTYLAVDTGGRIRGHLIDIFMRDLKEARNFGRRKIKLKILGRTAPVYLREKSE